MSGVDVSVAGSGDVPLFWRPEDLPRTADPAFARATVSVAFLVLGILISLQANFVRPEYFPKGFEIGRAHV